MSARSARHTLFWFRRDLRLEDNHGLWKALTQGEDCAGVFIFDTTILKQLPKEDARVSFIHGSLHALQNELAQIGKKIHIFHGDPVEIIPRITQEWQIDAVYTNRDYEPPALARDQVVEQKLRAMGVRFELCIDQTILDISTIFNKSFKPYQVFTPFKKNWLSIYTAEHSQAYTSEQHLQHLRVYDEKYTLIPLLEDMGFTAVSIPYPYGAHGAQQYLQSFLSKKIIHYHSIRDIPSSQGTSLLSLYNRFGCLSIRHLHRCIDTYLSYHPQNEGIETWRSELIWREFYFYIFHHFPHAYDQSFLADYQNIRWENNEEWFHAWKNGQTGFPIVDAAMLQLNTTGFMHNRLRMVVASFLTKDLLIDYRWGEAYFAEKLLDFDAAANNGGWQWAASTGCDAQPYFRVFHPTRQSEKFDPDGRFIHQYLPALKQVPARYLHAPSEHALLMPSYQVTLGIDYPYPIVDHAEQRLKAIQMYEQAKSKN